MRWEVIPAADGDRWNARLARLAHDVYHRSEYHRAHEGADGSEAWAYVAEAGDRLLFHPVVLRGIARVGDQKLDDGWTDTESVYGYSGPLASSGDPAFLAAAWRGYDEWCRARGVVAEFIRFTPLLANHRLAAAGTEIWRDRETVLLALDGGEEAIWNRYAAVHRNSIRKALKSGVNCAVESPPRHIAQFRALYDGTMRRLGAGAFYYFDDAYYATLVEALGDRLILVMASCEGREVAGALFLLHGDTMHYHLAGSAAEFRHLGVNNLVVHEAARWGTARGYRRLHLGGGRTPAPDDSLFRFKARFSPERLDLFLGKRIIEQAAYNDLVARWRVQNAGAAEPAYFKLYRLPTGTPAAS
jgi:hypothetical protein